MSAELLNLRLARKAKRRASAEEAAAAQRARHGRTRAERETEARDADRLARHLEGHRRVPDTRGDGS